MKRMIFEGARLQPRRNKWAWERALAPEVIRSWSQERNASVAKAAGEKRASYGTAEAVPLQGVRLAMHSPH